MPAIRFIVTKSAISFSHKGELHDFPANSLIITDNHAKMVRKIESSNTIIIDFFCADLQQLYSSVTELLDSNVQQTLSQELIKTVGAERVVIEVLYSLATLSADSFLQFCYTYCLTRERAYFSALLRQRISGNKEFCHFIEENFLQQWTISQIAENLDLPLRKFNQLFQDTYGKPAKRWLLERRLEHAKNLLITTPLRVIDIALECGFSNHAHFTDTFRRHYSCNPKQVREYKRQDSVNELRM
ncbi:hypothetical protein ASE93_14450 [Serratia sp. Leaf50]|uniref:helix-turn-helix domain-containing protein n=1 Tax=Rouxiella sp. S1S-2 TaxID=2653856 RepID=UPI0006F88682|nr:AraC family transcriptional regulator [Rouxiella sp. S1S-2]KAB7897036.1 helix-turn-helix domain-containing protein [Rouxiella sp. S1S-2]KQN46466.1 hypothetical protein ASE93_14450 [Serratia sp. Leaf50]